MKKIIALILTLVIITLSLAIFTGCGEDTLVVYTESGFAPFEYVKNGEIVGVDVDIMNLVGEKLGKEIVFDDVDFDIIVDEVSKGNLTNIGAAGISVTPARQEKVDFSNEYYTAELYVIYLNEKSGTFESMTTDNVTGIYWESLKGKNIAVQAGTTADLFAADEIEKGLLKDSGAKLTTYATLANAVADVGLNVDVLIIDELPAKKLIEGNNKLKASPLYYKGEDGEADEAATDTYAICVTKGQTELLEAINEVLAELGEEGIQALVDKHLGIK